MYKKTEDIKRRDNPEEKLKNITNPQEKQKNISKKKERVSDEEFFKNKANAFDDLKKEEQ